MIQNSVLVTGSTGYVGGRLIPFLLESGYTVRAMGRSMEKMESRTWAGHPNVELAKADVFDQGSLEKAAEGCWAAFYLVHSMEPGIHNFEQADRDAAEKMSAAASRAGLNWGGENSLKFYEKTR